MTLKDINEAESDINNWDVLLHLYHRLFSALQHMRGGAHVVRCYLFIFLFFPPLPGSRPSKYRPLSSPVMTRTNERAAHLVSGCCGQSEVENRYHLYRGIFFFMTYCQTKPSD